MAAWIERIREILDPGPLRLDREDRWKLSCCQRLLDRLGPRWILESEATKGLGFPHTSLFWAAELGLIERRRRGIFKRRSWIRLSGRAWVAE